MLDIISSALMIVIQRSKEANQAILLPASLDIIFPSVHQLTSGIHPDKKTFPSGMNWLTKQIHDLGLYVSTFVSFSVFHC
jgi:hypothetical protein